jgi:hypothetical protein
LSFALTDPSTAPMFGRLLNDGAILSGWPTPLPVASNLPPAVSAVGSRRRVGSCPRNPRAGPPVLATLVDRFVSQLPVRLIGERQRVGQIGCRTGTGWRRTDCASPEDPDTAGFMRCLLVP